MKHFKKAIITLLTALAPTSSHASISLEIIPGPPPNYGTSIYANAGDGQYEYAAYSPPYQDSITVTSAFGTASAALDLTVTETSVTVSCSGSSTFGASAPVFYASTFDVQITATEPFQFTLEATTSNSSSGTSTLVGLNDSGGAEIAGASSNGADGDPASVSVTEILPAGIYTFAGEAEGEPYLPAGQSSISSTLNVEPVPEPTAGSLLLVALAFVICARRNKWQKGSTEVLIHVQR